MSRYLTAFFNLDTVARLYYVKMSNVHHPTKGQMFRMINKGVRRNTRSFYHAALSITDTVIHIWRQGQKASK